MDFIKYFKKVYLSEKPKPKKENANFFVKQLTENLERFKIAFKGSSDLSVRYLDVSGTKSAVISIDGMIDKNIVAQSLLMPVINANVSTSVAKEKYEYIRDNVIPFSDVTEVTNFQTAFNKIMSGFALFAMDGCDCMLCIGVQGFPYRSVGEPSTEVMQRGSREGFVEPINMNISLIRRRLKNTNLKFELSEIGCVSKTSICMCYMKDKVAPEVLDKVRDNISKIDIETVVESGYLISYLESDKDFSLFSGVGMTERPDTVCGKISEGRIAILVDGTPNALIVPYLFIEYFQHLDDYTRHPYFSTFTRWLKYLAFFVSILLPGLYVGISTFNPEILPMPIFTKIALAVGTTPFSLMTETIIIHLMYEVMREAGLRIPRPLGHAVSIVGALVIGETAVSSGLIGAPTLMVVALTAISSYVIPNLYEPISILKFAFVVIGGFFGIWGIMIVLTAVLINLCAKNTYGIPFTSPISPFNLFAMRDVLMRFGWDFLSRKNIKIQNLPGSEVKK